MTTEQPARVRATLTAHPARVRVLLTAALLMLTVLPGLTSPAGAADPQYPDLKTLEPRDLRFGTATIDGRTHRVLKFSNTVYNDGPGRLDVVGNIDPRTLRGPAYQRVYGSDGNYDQYSAGQLYWHDIHSHFHYEDWGRYELWTKAAYDSWVASGRTSGDAAFVGSKTTSCIMDEEFIKELPSTPWPARYGSDGCDLQPDSTLHEGLSPGWGDTYDWYRDEQWIDLDSTRLGDGDYVLRSVTDPLNIIRESPGGNDTAKESQADNEAATPFAVRGGVIQDGAAPTGTISLDQTAKTTAQSTVTVSAMGRDDVSGVDSFRLSNDGRAWKTFPFTPNSSAPTKVTWSLTDPEAGGTSATGTKTVHAQFHDKAGKWGPTTTDTIVYGDGGPPTGPPPEPPTEGYAGTVAADGPVAYWRLGETAGTTAADSVGRHPGAYSRVTQGRSSLVPTEADPSAGFSGDSAVTVPDSSELRLASPFSLEAWIHPTSLPSSGGWASVVTKAESYSLQFAGPLLEFTVIQNGSRMRLRAPAGTITTDKTFHVVGSYDGVTQRLYVNDSLVGSQPLSAAVTPVSRPVVIGSWSGSNEFFTGRIDDVAVYAKALTGTQVSRHYDAGRGGPAPTTTHVAVTVDGTGTGTVTSEPAGITCPPTCEKDYPSGTQVTLTAAVAAGSSFQGWTDGACEGPTPQCTFNAYATTTATATFLSEATSARYSNLVLADGPAAYWRLGEPSGTGAADAAGTSNGTYTNGAAPGAPSLLARDSNTSVRLDGSNDHVSIGSPAAVNVSTNFSLEAWVKPASLPSGWASVLTKRETYSLQFAGPQMEFTVIQNYVRKRLRAPSGAVRAGEASHVVGTYDGSRQRLYVNGAEVASAPLSGPASRYGTPLLIGAWSPTSEFFAGQVDEVAVYAKVLTPQQVRSHYEEGAVAPR